MLNGISSLEFSERIDGTTHKIVQKTILGSSPPLFNCSLRPGQPRAIALRHDVDCCLWLQHLNPTTGDWNLLHEGTLFCFGYVQASKQQKKFMSCSPDMNYGVICESKRYLFIYKSSYSTASGLRKRTGQQTSIGQQKLITFDNTNGEIIGLSAENDILLLLTENNVVCLQLSIEE